MSKRILVFPGGMPRSLAYRDQASEHGNEVVGASSLFHDTARSQYAEWCYLPYVTSAEFNGALRKAVVDLGIQGIYTPNAVVWNYLFHQLNQICPGVSLVNSAPMEAEVAPYRKAIEFGQAVFNAPLPVAAAGTGKPSASVVELASLFHHADMIPGMCDHEKIRALCEVFKYCPEGDIVEIGSWWGKSAYIMMQLASFYEIGKLLCVDPWSHEHIIQNDEKGLVDRVDINASEALTIFQLNLLPFGKERVNYLRLPSSEAANVFRQNNSIHTEIFGETIYSGKISVLHIDGNHSYESVVLDVESWCDLVMPLGWIIFDDYIWPYGDGPQQAGNEFLSQHRGRISVAFVIGSALFIQLAF